MSIYRNLQDKTHHKQRNVRNIREHSENIFPPAGVQRSIWVSHSGVAKDSTLLECDAVTVLVPDD